MKTLPLYAGLDVHQEFTVGTLVDELGNAVRELKVPTSPKGYEQLFFGMGSNVTAVFEAGRNWWYIASLLKPYCSFKMAHPLKVRAIASARIKTDEIDSRILAHLLRTNLIPESYMPPDDIVDLRNLVRYRVRLGRMSAHLKNRTHSILAREGHHSDFKPYEKKAKLWIQNLKMKPINRDELEHTLKLIQDLKVKTDELDELLEKERIKYPQADLLTSIPGISTYSALLILAEIGDFSRFPTADKLAAYSGLVSSTHQSGNTCYQGRITKQGNVWLRWMLTQCVHASVKKQHRLQKFYLRIKHRRGTQKAITATARKMLTTIWYMLQHNEAYHG